MTPSTAAGPLPSPLGSSGSPVTLSTIEAELWESTRAARERIDALHSEINSIFLRQEARASVESRLRAEEDEREREIRAELDRLADMEDDITW